MVLNECSYCKINPRSHSFHEVSHLQNQLGQRVFYSRPADAELYQDTVSILHHFECKLEGVSKWEWTFDCAGMGIEHYTQFGLVKELCLLLKRHGGLQQVNIINAGCFINFTVKFAKLIWPELPTIHIR